MTELLSLLRTHRYALAAAGTYLVFGVAWVLGSDYVIATLSDDARLLSRLQSAKGSVFILVSAVAIYFMIRLQGRDEGDVAQLAAEVPAGERQPLRLQLLLLTAATTLPCARKNFTAGYAGSAAPGSGVRSAIPVPARPR